VYLDSILRNFPATEPAQEAKQLLETVGK
jgi:hypothetical protein